MDADSGVTYQVPPHRLPVGDQTDLATIRVPAVEPDSIVVHLDHVPHRARLAEIARWMQTQDFTRLSVSGYYDGSSIDLEFLEHFRFLTSLSIPREIAVRSIAGLRFLSSQLTVLYLGSSRRVPSRDLGYLHALEGLEDLWLNGSVVNSLPEIGNLGHLKALHLHGGGLPDLAAVTRFAELRFLEIWNVRGLSNFDALGALPTLEVLKLDTLCRFERFPDMSGSTALRRLHTGELRSLIDVSGLRSAAALVEVSLGLCPRLDPAQLSVLTALPLLKRIDVGLGTNAKDSIVSQMIGAYGRPEYPAPWDRWNQW